MAAQAGGGHGQKNVSEPAVDLAYASVPSDDEAPARVVLDPEVEVDGLPARLTSWVLWAAAELDDSAVLYGSLHLANSAKLIRNPALGITEGILRNIDTHPVIAESVRESEIAVCRVRVGPVSGYNCVTVGVLLAEHPGVSPVAVDRVDDQCVLYPDDEDLDSGDAVIVRGSLDATERLVSNARTV